MFLPGVTHFEILQCFNTFARLQQIVSNKKIFKQTRVDFELHKYDVISQLRHS